jgi:hypothetical protein
LKKKNNKMLHISIMGMMYLKNELSYIIYPIY